MTSKSINHRVLNSLVFIRDPQIRDIPEIDGRSAVWSTKACVAVSCLPDCDGETKITIGAEKEIKQDGVLLFDGQVETPSRTVVVETVLSETLLEASVPNIRTRVRIWTDGFPDAEKVVIGLG